MSFASDTSAKITLQVELKSDVSSPTLDQENLSPIGIKNKEELETILHEILKSKEEKGETITKEEVSKIKELQSNLEKIDSQGMATLSQFTKNPSSFMENEFLSLLGRAGPQGAIIVAIIAMIVASPEIYRAIIEQMGVKGGPLNQDWRLSQEEQMGLELNRMTQFGRVIGDDPIITLQTRGYIVGDPDFVFNSIVEIDKARTGRITNMMNSLGYITGI